MFGFASRTRPERRVGVLGGGTGAYGAYVYSDQSPETERPYPPRKEPIIHFLCPACSCMTFLREDLDLPVGGEGVTVVTCIPCGARVELVRPKSSAQSSLKGVRTDIMWVDEWSDL